MNWSNYVAIVPTGCEVKKIAHEFVDCIEHGPWPSYGFGTMKYRECKNCGYIEWSHYYGDDGKEVDIDEIRNAPCYITNLAGDVIHVVQTENF